MAYSVSNDYKRVIYSQDDENDIKIWFNNVELQDAGLLTESVSGTFRCLANDGKKRFSLDSFMAKEVELIIHDVDEDDIQDQVKISIGTLVNNAYEYVPIGIFNIQDTPTTNNGKTTIKLRDNAVKFDFGYNAQPLIENNYVQTSDTNYLENKMYYSYNSQSEEYEQLVAGTDYTVGDAISGTVYEKKNAVTYMQILQDICTKAGVTCSVSSFDNQNFETTMYDNTINARIYVCYIAAQCGMIPAIDRDGNLIFVDLANASTWRIPYSLISDNFEYGVPYTIERVVYESGIVKLETDSDESLSTLYLDASNPYIIAQSQVDDILTKYANFEIDSIKMATAILGNPAIDPYDIIEVYDDEDENETVMFKTLANCTYTFKGNHRQLFDTQIGVEQRTENVTKNSDATFKRWAKTTIDIVEGQIQLTSGTIEEMSSNIASLNVTAQSISTEVANQTTSINELGQTISQINSVIQEQTSDAITTWFNQSGIEGTLNDLQSAIDNNSDDLETIKVYIREGILDGNPYIELGKANNQTIIRILPERIQFLTNGEETAYISNNSLYINESTILTRQQIGHWVTVEDSSNNLNTYWVD